MQRWPYEQRGHEREKRREIVRRGARVVSLSHALSVRMVIAASPEERKIVRLLAFHLTVSVKITLKPVENRIDAACAESNKSLFRYWPDRDRVRNVTRSVLSGCYCLWPLLWTVVAKTTRRISRIKLWYVTVAMGCQVEIGLCLRCVRTLVCYTLCVFVCLVLSIVVWFGRELRRERESKIQSKSVAATWRTFDKLILAD